jgi:hypothetical protein
MKFTINKLIAVTAVLILGLCPTMAMGKRVDAPALKNDFSENPTFGAEKEGSIVFTQNDHSTPDDEAKTASGSDTTESKPESAPANDDKNKSSKAESKPLKPFVPSEKIPGEQAVDFPVDI